MKLYTILHTDFEHADERGKLIQLVHEGYQQVNVLISGQGMLRGAHYHRLRREAFYVVSGSAVFTFTAGEQSETVLFRPGEFFAVEPNVVHSLYFPEGCVMVQLYDLPVELPDGTKDILRDDLA